MLRRVLPLLALLLACASAHAASTCFVTEFRTQTPAAYPVAVQTPLAEQTVAASGTSASSSAFQPQTTLVRIVCDVAVSIEFGATPTASATTAFLPANTIEYYAVPAGLSLKVAVITNT